MHGAWRSLVAHLLWEQGVAGSNPAAPIRIWLCGAGLRRGVLGTCGAQVATRLFAADLANEHQVLEVALMNDSWEPMVLVDRPVEPRMRKTALVAGRTRS
jgi:hypothetical protein